MTKYDTKHDGRELRSACYDASGTRHISSASLITTVRQGTHLLTSTTGGPGNLPLLLEFAEWYQQPKLSSVLTAEHLKQCAADAGRIKEANLWALMEDILVDAEHEPKYHPDAIGIANMQPHRRWFISHFAHIQDCLLRQPRLRRMNLICRWLERTYRAGGQREAKLFGEDDLVMRQLVLFYIRGGMLHDAIETATTYRDGVYSCVLSAAQLQTVREPWFSHTSLTPLFGEYGNGELDQVWCGNEHRLDNLSQLYQESVRSAETTSQCSSASIGSDSSSSRRAMDAIISAALCGNLEVLEAAFAMHGDWQDMVWCHLRCGLVVAFTKVLMNSQVPVDPSYASFIERMTGSGDDWLNHLMEDLIKRLTGRLRDAFLAHAAMEDQLPMRFILQVLSSDSVEWFDIRPDDGNREATRLIAHAFLILDMAHSESLLYHTVQVHAGESFAHTMAQYARYLAVLPDCPYASGMQATIGMARRLCDPHHRALVYATFLIEARRRSIDRIEFNHAEIEEQEAFLVRLFAKEDPDRQVCAEVRRLLNQKVEDEHLLTHNVIAEQVMWEAMHATTWEDYSAVLRHGFEACVGFWLASPHAELDAITDVSGILMRRVLPHLVPTADDANNKAMVPEMERNEATFWYLFTEARTVAQEHAKVAAELGVSRAVSCRSNSDRTLLFQLAQDEAVLLKKQYHVTARAVRHAGALVRRVPQCATAPVWLVQQFTEDVTLSLLNGDLLQSTAWVEYLQEAMGLVEELEEGGYLHPNLLPQDNACELYAQIRTMRITYGQRTHKVKVQDLLEKVKALQPTAAQLTTSQT